MVTRTVDHSGLSPAEYDQYIEPHCRRRRTMDASAVGPVSIAASGGRSLERRSWPDPQMCGAGGMLDVVGRIPSQFRSAVRVASHQISQPVLSFAEVASH